MGERGEELQPEDQSAWVRDVAVATLFATGLSAWIAFGADHRPFPDVDGRTHPVGGKGPNAFGLYDMPGNVWEWVHDWNGSYPGGTVADPRGPESGSGRMNRGGGWFGDTFFCRASVRRHNAPDRRLINLGFRLARTCS